MVGRQAAADTRRFGCDGGEESALAGRTQWHEWFAGLAAEALDGQGGFVADAVDGEEDGVGAGDEASEEADLLVDTAVVVAEGWRRGSR